jgi:predicted nucleic acid-binding protein
MKFLLDTSAFSDLMREDPRVVQHLAATPVTDRVAICTTVRGEILFGIERLPQGKRRTYLSDKASQLFAVVACEVISELAGDHYARIKVASQRRGLSLDENDLWIAATALSLSATLISRDTDFGRVDGLSVADWTQ